MSRVKKKLSVLSVLLSLEFLSLGVINGSFSWSNQHPPPSLNAASYMDGKAAKLDSPPKIEGRFVERYGELTPRWGDFLTAKKNVGVSHRSFIVVPLFFRINLAPKVSRYIFNLFSISDFPLSDLNHLLTTVMNNHHP